MTCKLNSRKFCGNECDICFNKSFASHDKSQYWSKLNNITSIEVLKGTNKKYYFDCDCGHTFDVSLSNVILKNAWCPYCANKKLCNNDNCISCFNKSFASQKKSKYLVDKNIHPRQIFIQSNKKYNFKCNKCLHIFDIAICHIQTNWCPYCSNQKLCSDENCNKCYNKSFAPHKKSKYWSKQNENNPRQIFLKSNKYFKFDCKCGHTFTTRLNSVSEGNWCSYCGNKKLCENNKCKSCFNKSFSSNPKSKYWSKNNKLNPRQVFKNSHTKFEFNCENNHIFIARLYNVNNNYWCPICVHKTETLIYNFLKKNYSVSFQAKYKWCKNKKTDNYLPFDFAIDKYKILIELDGDQHFKQVAKWKSPEHTQKRDLYKMKRAMKNGYTIIRLLQEDVWNNKYNWKKKLRKYIHDYEHPECIFLSKGDEYKCFENN